MSRRAVVGAALAAPGAGVAVAGQPEALRPGNIWVQVPAGAWGDLVLSARALAD